MNVYSFINTLAVETGKRLKRMRKGLRLYDLSFKSRRDIVTRADVEIENFITNKIKKHFPGHVVLAEELHAMNDKESYDDLWIVDPLDGTINYVHDFPFYCVSIAYQSKGKIECGAVYAPVLDELFYARRGHGSYLNKRRIYVSKETNLMDAMLATGFPYKLDDSRTNNLKPFNTLIKKTRALRRPGSAAIDLCYVAMGRFDGFWEFGLKPWDIAAGMIIIREAGGRVTDFQGDDDLKDLGELVASNNHLHSRLLSTLKPFSNKK